MTRKKKTPPSENDRNKVQVLTAGGAAGTTLPSTRRGQSGGSAAAKTKAAAATSSSSSSAASPSPSQQQDKKKQARENTIEEQRRLELEDEEDNNIMGHPGDDGSTGRLAGSHQPYSDKTGLINNSQDDPTRGMAGKSHNSPQSPHDLDPHHLDPSITIVADRKKHDVIWLTACFLGIMGSFVIYGLLLEYTTSGGRKLHELSFLFVTSGLYTLTAAAGRYVRDETPTTIPPARFAVLGLTSMGSTFCSVRSLRCVFQ